MLFFIFVSYSKILNVSISSDDTWQIHEGDMLPSRLGKELDGETEGICQFLEG